MKVFNQEAIDEYWNCVESIASEARDVYEFVTAEGAPDPDSHMFRYAEESVRGSRWTIYTSQALLVLGVSDNVDAAADAFGAIQGPSVEAVVSRSAYCAMLADVLQTVEEEEFIPFSIGDLLRGERLVALDEDLLKGGAPAAE